MEQSGSSPRYYELPHNAVRAMPVASNGRLSQGYWPVDEAGIEVEGEYSTMRYQ